MEIGDKVKTNIYKNFWFIGTYSDNFPDSDKILIDNGKSTLIVAKNECVMADNKNESAALTLHDVTISEAEYCDCPQPHIITTTDGGTKCSLCGKWLFKQY